MKISNREYQRLCFLAVFFHDLTDPTMTDGKGHEEAKEMIEILNGATL